MVVQDIGAGERLSEGFNRRLSSDESIYASILAFGLRKKERKMRYLELWVQGL